MTMFVKNWKKVVKLSFSFWAGIAGILLHIFEEAAYRFSNMELDPYLLNWVTLLLIVYGVVGRLFEQTDDLVREWFKFLAILSGIYLSAVFLSNPAYAVAPDDEFLAVATPLVAKWEGKENHAYLDTIARPPIWTVCYGETRGVKSWHRYTDQQCWKMLGVALIEYRNGLHEYFTCDTLTNRLPARRDAAYTSLAYNVGVHRAGTSTATKRLNKGDIKGGCRAITWYNKAGGKVIRGLSNRRSDEYKQCMA